jgi:hypothetical protein
VEVLLVGDEEKFAVEVLSFTNCFISLSSIARYFDVQEEGLRVKSAGVAGKAVGPDDLIGRSGDVKVVGNVDEDEDEEEEWVEMGNPRSVAVTEQEMANNPIANEEEATKVVSIEVVIGKVVGLDEVICRSGDVIVVGTIDEEKDEDEVQEEWVAVANEEEDADVVSNEVVVACCS